MSKKLNEHADVVLKESFYSNLPTASLREERSKIRTFAEYVRETHFPTTAVNEFWLQFFDLARSNHRLIEDRILFNFIYAYRFGKKYDVEKTIKSNL